MPRVRSLMFLALLSTALMGSDCGEPEAVSLSELRRDVAPPFDYDLYCDPRGMLVGERSAVLLVYRSVHLERVYADAQAGHERAQVLFGQLEDTLRRAGADLADKAQGMVCHSAPACSVQWHFLDEMMPSRRAGGMRLRGLMAASFERRAKLKGVENAVLVGALDVLLAGSLLKSAATGAAEASSAAAEARSGAVEAAKVTREATLEQRLGLSGLKGRLAVEEVAALEARLAEAEVLEVGARQPARLEALANHRPALNQPPAGVAADNPRWTAYVQYWERRYEQLAGTRPVPAGQMEVKPPLTWNHYAALLGRFQQALEFQRSVARVLQQEVRASGWERGWLRGLERPIVAENVGLAREGGASLTFVDQLVVDEATLRSAKPPVVHSFSNKQHDFTAKSKADAVRQLETDVREALTKYGGSVEVRRPGHLLFGRKVVVSRVHLVYDGTGLTPSIREALSREAPRLGIELHFHAP